MRVTMMVIMLTMMTPTMMLITVVAAVVHASLFQIASNQGAKEQPRFSCWQLSGKNLPKSEDA